VGGVGIEPDRALIEGPGVYSARRHLDWSRPQAVCRMCFMIDLQNAKGRLKFPWAAFTSSRCSYTLAALGILLCPELRA
jgi:hypothetical protein